MPLLSVMELALVAGIVAVALRTPAARNPVLWAALGAGFLVATLTQLVPEKGAGLLGDALRFELPKTLHYWVPVPLAILAASGVAAVLRLAALPAGIRGVAVTAFVAAAVLPIRTTPIDAFLLGEHRISETLSIAMRWSERGFWQGFPDPRFVVDEPRRADPGRGAGRNRGRQDRPGHADPAHRRLVPAVALDAPRRLHRRDRDGCDP